MNPASERGISERLKRLPGVALVHVFDDPDHAPFCFAVLVYGGREAEVRSKVEEVRQLGTMPMIRVIEARWYHHAWAWCDRVATGFTKAMMRIARARRSR